MRAQVTELEAALAVIRYLERDAPRSVFAHSEFLAWQARSDDRYRARCVTIRDTSGDPLAAIPFFTTVGDAAGTPHYDAYAHFAGALDLERTSSRDEWHPGIVVGLKSGFDNPVVLPRRGVDDATLAVALDVGLRALLELAEAEGMRAVCALYVRRDSVAAVRQLLPASAAVILDGAQMTVELSGATFDDYLGTLTNRRRATIRRERRQFDAAGWTLERGTLADVAPWAASLLVAVDAQFGAADDVSTEAGRLAVAASALNEGSFAFWIHDGGGPPIAVSFGFVRGDAMVVWGWGGDAARLRDAFEYFNLVYYLPIELAASRGLRRVHFGILAYDAKANRGAHAAPVYGALLRAPGLRARAPGRSLASSHRVATTIQASAALPDGWEQVIR